jgi:hypothetical protein
MLFDPEKSQFFHLNVTASFLWSHLAEPSTAEQLASEICKSFDGAGFADALRDTEEMLAQMLAHGLIVVVE